MSLLGLSLAVVDQIDDGWALIELPTGAFVYADCLAPWVGEGDRLFYRPTGEGCPFHLTTHRRKRQHNQETA